ncbi:hypothetical protein LCGC14_2378900 [marine sediment metagenome]|uniref:Uncharacterized protein n=1 Tax=marine sediment metagenome TaxID=412755 RepID=A0A0F9C1M8_9ZZZZ
MSVVYIVIYSNHFVEEWAVKGVFEDAEKADLLAKDLDEGDKDVWSRYSVEEWSMADV